MIDTPAMPVLERRRRHASFHENERTRPPISCLDLDDVGVVEMVAADGYSAALLLEYAAPTFRGEIVHGSDWVVRFRAPASDGNWAVELLALVEQWPGSGFTPPVELIDGAGPSSRGPGIVIEPRARRRFVPVVDPSPGGCDCAA